MVVCDIYFINIHTCNINTILSRVGVTYKTEFGLNDWIIGFIAPYTFTQFRTTGNTALSLFYTLSVHCHTHIRVLSPP
jgi:hypothetical protein